MKALPRGKKQTAEEKKNEMIRKVAIAVACVSVFFFFIKLLFL